MEKVYFHAKGHHNILGRHRNTIEFTKDKELSLRGDCIIAVESDFSDEDMKKVLSWEKARVIMRCSGMEESFTGMVNESFKSDHELVFRITDFASERTLLTRCDRACKDLKRAFIDVLKHDYSEITVILEKIE